MTIESVYRPPRVFLSGPVSWNTLVSVDRLPSTGGPTLFATGQRRALGGTSAGKALNLSRLGVSVTLKTIPGSGPDRSRILAALEQPGIHLIDAGDPDSVTEQHFNLMSEDGGRQSIYLSIASLPSDPSPPAAVDALSRVDVAVLDLAEHSRPLIALAREYEIPVWVDLHDYDGIAGFHRDFAGGADVIVFSDERMPDPEPFMRRYVERGVRLVVCTRGARGTIAMDNSGLTEVPAVPVEQVIDSNGAGDAFFSGLLFGHLTGRDLQTSLRYGAVAGALAVQSLDLASDRLSPALFTDG